jgi:hypothetical protein
MKSVYMVPQFETIRSVSVAQWYSIGFGIQRSLGRAQPVLKVFCRHGASNVILRSCGFFGRLYVISALRLERKLTGYRELHL